MRRKLRILEAAGRSCACVWDTLSDYADVTTVQDGEQAYRLLQRQKFELVLVNLVLPGLDGSELLRRIRREKLCPLVVLTSEAPNFAYARQGIVSGAFDYLLRPLANKELTDLIFRAEEALFRLDDATHRQCGVIVRGMRRPEAEKQFLSAVQQLRQEQPDAAALELAAERLYRAVLRQTFSEMPWLAQFQCAEDYLTDDGLPCPKIELVTWCSGRLADLNRVVCSLYPETGDRKMDAVLRYLLEQIDEKCLQAEVAAEHYISSTTLSELFQRRLGMPYRTYLTDARMLRAQHLLRHSDKKIYEISTLLGYKDVNYFSRVFKQRYGVSLSAFRSRSAAAYEI